MHYHIVITDGAGEHLEQPIFASLSAAEHAVPVVIQRLDDRVWQPKRYPGRSAQRDEIAVYLDRAHPEQRREISIIRCHTAAPAIDLGCHFWGRHEA
jgi:hypothetical protein